MASELSNSNNKSKKLKKAKKQARVNSEEQLERLDSLPWNSSLAKKDDAFSFLIGSNELEGGFLSLEEIDETEYALNISKPENESEEKISKGKPKSKKRKISERDESSVAEDGSANEEELENKEMVDGELKELKQNKSKKKKKNKSKKKDTLENAAEKNAEQAAVTEVKEADDEESVDESEYLAWNELRLHPLLMKSIYRLKFKEPTQIQKACIPAAAHRGKDVVGAAETGSGKTLAFGLPILQRLLEEQDKVEKLISEYEEADERIASRGFLRALIITPTRELALQVTDHLKEVAKFTKVMVVPIVGGMSTEKQEKVT